MLLMEVTTTALFIGLVLVLTMPVMSSLRSRTIPIPGRSCRLTNFAVPAGITNLLIGVSGIGLDEIPVG